MKSGYFYALALTLIFGFYACSSKKINRSHNSQNSLDWAGLYTGTLPCADCEGIQTVIRLDTNNNYKIESTYLGKDEKPDVKEGTFSWDKDGGRLMLNNVEKGTYPIYYLVGENQLVQLDLTGKPIMSEMASRYILKKEDNAVVEKYWKLVELNGKPVQGPAEGEREVHLILKANGNVQGNGGCNGFGGKYELQAGNRIKFSQVFSTKMACPNLDTENQFFEVLNTADNYTVVNDTLSLNKARMAPLAKFVAVYL